MSFDAMGYPQFDDCREIADQFYGNIISQRDAEIERLKAEIIRLHNMIEDRGIEESR